MSPLVSVIIPAYGHEHHVAAAIDSARQQDYPNLEILVQDDCSPDNTWAVILQRAAQDSRIIASQTPRNIGGAANQLDLVRRAKGRYVAVLSSDDIWLPHKTAHQVDALEAAPGAVALIGQPEIVNSDGHPRPDHPARASFASPIREPMRLLRHLFDHGNMLCHPASLVRREAFLDIPSLDTVQTYASLPDFFLWVSLGGLGDLLMDNEIVTRFRLHDDGSNASSSSMLNNIRDRNEFPNVLRAFLDYPTERLQAVFADRIPAGLSHPSTAICLARYAARRLPRVYASFAANIALEVMKRPENVSICMNEIGFGLRELHRFTSWCDSLGTAQAYLDGIIQSQWSNRSAAQDDKQGVAGTS